MAKNGNIKFLLLELILADKLADLPHPLVEASSGQEWQFQISTIRAHFGSSTGRCTPHRGTKNGNLRFLLLELILADQVAPADLPP